MRPAATDLVRKSQLDTLLAAKAPLASPALTGTPTAPTAAPATNTTQIATTAFVQEALSAAGAGDMSKSVYDTTNNGKVDVAETAGGRAVDGGHRETVQLRAVRAQPSHVRDHRA